MARLRTATMLLAGFVAFAGAAWAEPPQDKPSRRTDRYGDPLPQGAMARAGTLRLRHRDEVCSIVFSRDGKRLISTSEALHSGHDGPSIRIWDLATGKLITQFGGQLGGAGTLALSPDGRILASKGADGSVWLWDLDSGERIRECEKQEVTYRRSIAFSADGKVLASNGSEIALWDVHTGATLRRIKVRASQVLFSPDGRLLVSGDMRTISFSDPATAQQRREIPHGIGMHGCLAISPDSKILISAGDDGIIRLWDIATGKESRQLTGHGKDVYGLAVSPDGKILASVGGDGTVRLWDLATGKQLHRIAAHGIDAYCVCFSPDGKTLASGGYDCNIHLWDVATAKELLPFEGHRQSIFSFAFSPDGKTLASGGWDQAVRLIDPATGKELTVLRGHRDWVETVAFSPDGQLLASGGGHRDPAIRLWQTSTGKEIRQLAGLTGGVRSLAFLPNSRFLASASGDRMIRLWDTDSGKELGRALRNKKMSVAQAIAFSPDGKALASAERGAVVDVWDVATGEQLGRIVGHTHDVVWSVAYSLCGRIIASGGEDATIRWWDAITGQELRPPTQCGNSVRSVAFSPDGRLLLSGGDDERVCLWETATATEVRRFSGHERPITSVAFAPDGRTTASASEDSTILFWDVTGRLDDGRLRLSQLTAQELAQHWDTLSGDAAAAYSAVWTLAASDQAVCFLKERLRPATPVAAEKIARLIAALDDDEFAVREKAMKDLEGLEEKAETALRQAVENGSVEVRWRAGQLLAKLSSPLPPERLRQLRAVAALEYNGTPQARDVLRTLTGGAPEARLTREAKAALERLEKRAKK